ncbi:MAG: hypothetical protein HN403_14285 [Rhodospirillales bacterium]|jgi:hypothetical protein|nr:hypothetical protein [Rhodospirillales bacterium]
MAKDNSQVEDHREKPRRRIEGPHDGTRSGTERRQAKEEEWPYFEKRGGDERRSGENRRSGLDRRED